MIKVFFECICDEIDLAYKHYYFLSVNKYPEEQVEEAYIEYVALCKLYRKLKLIDD